MHGMINRGLQSFVTHIYGADIWREVCARSNLSLQNFEAMLYYEDSITDAILTSIGAIKDIERSDLLEDFGTFLASEHSSPTVRKLLRLGGATYEEFLYSLEDLHDRVGLAVPDLDLPILTLEVQPMGRFVVHYESAKLGYGAIVLGILRTIADSYHSFVVITHVPSVVAGISIDRFEIEVIDTSRQDSPDIPFSKAS